jgi:hypothetical protein
MLCRSRHRAPHQKALIERRNTAVLAVKVGVTHRHVRVHRTIHLNVQVGMFTDLLQYATGEFFLDRAGDGICWQGRDTAPRGCWKPRLPSCSVSFPGSMRLWLSLAVRVG